MTGDLVNLGLPEEFLRAAEWLHHLGPPGAGSPPFPAITTPMCGCTRSAAPRHWRPYMESNAAGEALFPTPPERFPFVRRFGDVALIALSSAIPTMPFIAAGKVGIAAARVPRRRARPLGREGLFRVVLIHHPPLRAQAGWHRGLRDAEEGHQDFARHGAELVLHGHNHAQTVHELDTATGPAFVVGVPSASEAVEGRSPAAR